MVKILFWSLGGIYPTRIKYLKIRYLHDRPHIDSFIAMATTTVTQTEEAILKLTLAYDKEIHEEVR